MMKTSLEGKRERAGFYFVLPPMTIFTISVFIPLIITFIFSFLEFDIMSQNLQFQELGNYAKLAGDKKFWDVLSNTVYYTAFTAPVQIGLVFVTAAAVKKKRWLNGFFRPAYLIPTICSMTIVSTLWSFLINPGIGTFCYWAKLLGFNPINILSSPTWAMPMVIFTSVWKSSGLNMVILLAGLSGIDGSYYEAANIDGVTGFQKFRGITTPVLMLTSNFTVVNCVVGSFQVFGQMYIMTKDGPLFKTQTLVQPIHSMAFGPFNTDYAPTIAAALFIITFTISVFISKHMVKGEEDLD